MLGVNWPLKLRLTQSQWSLLPCGHAHVIAMSCFFAFFITIIQRPTAVGSHGGFWKRKSRSQSTNQLFRSWSVNPKSTQGARHLFSGACSDASSGIFWISGPQWCWRQTFWPLSWIWKLYVKFTQKLKTRSLFIHPLVLHNLFTTFASIEHKGRGFVCIQWKSVGNGVIS